MARGQEKKGKSPPNKKGESLVQLYTPHPGQLKLHNSQARFRVCCTGRRWGKTLACSNEIAKHGLESNNVLCWWVAPTYRQSMIAYRILKKALWPVVAGARVSDMTLQLINGSRIEFKSADNFDALRGEGVNFLVIDEAALIPREAWEAAIRPTLSDTLGRGILASTPRGRNWFFEAYCRGSDREYLEWESFSFPTRDNPRILASEIEEARRTLPSAVFQQEYLAEFLEDSAGVFRGIKDCISGVLEPPSPTGRYVIGWDLAKLRDFSVLVVLDSQRNHVVAFDRFNQVDYALQLDRVEILAKKYRASVLMDSSGVGDPVLEQVKRRRIPVKGYTITGVNKQQLIEHLAVAIEQRRISYPRIPELVHELELYGYEPTRAGNLKYSAPAGQHDDCVIALALAVWASKTLPPPVVTQSIRKRELARIEGY